MGDETGKNLRSDSEVDRWTGTNQMAVTFQLMKGKAGAEAKPSQSKGAQMIKALDPVVIVAIVAILAVNVV